MFKIILFFLICAFFITHCSFAEVYFFEDFESFSDGDEIVANSDVWVSNNPNALVDAVASKEMSYPVGGISASFGKASQCIGMDFDGLKLPEKYVLSCYYYHYSEEKPPDMMVCLIRALRLSLGTHSESENPDNYTYKDNFGREGQAALYHDTKVPRKTDWVNFVFSVSEEGTDLLIDGKKVYTSFATSATFTGFFMGTMWDAPKKPVYIDYLVIADTIEEAQTRAIESSPKLSTTWGSIKVR